MDETEELIRLCVRALVAQMGDVPGVELHLTRSCVLGLTGEPLADFNMLTLGADPDAEGRNGLNHLLKLDSYQYF